MRTAEGRPWLCASPWRCDHGRAAVVPHLVPQVCCSGVPPLPGGDALVAGGRGAPAPEQTKTSVPGAGVIVGTAVLERTTRGTAPHPCPWFCAVSARRSRHFLPRPASGIAICPGRCCGRAVALLCAADAACPARRSGGRIVSEVGLGHRAAAMGLKGVAMERIPRAREGAEWIIDFSDW